MTRASLRTAAMIVAARDEAARRVREADAARVEIVSFGKERPVCAHDAESCWQQNRRDDFAVTAGAAAQGGSNR